MTDPIFNPSVRTDISSWNDVPAVRAAAAGTTVAPDPTASRLNVGGRSTMRPTNPTIRRTAIATASARWGIPTAVLSTARSIPTTATCASGAGRPQAGHPHGSSLTLLHSHVHLTSP